MIEDITRRKHGGNEESEAAHERIAPHKTNLRLRIYEWLQFHGPATCEEVSIALGLRYTTVSARLSELRVRGMVIPTGETKPTSGGSPAALLKPAPTPTQMGQRGLFSPTLE